jgi:peptidoglycan/xylan/chitin deacetylase (PgdA/CDA1 family)
MSSVLVYHSISSPAEAMPGDIDISPERFRRQVRWLSRWRTVVPLIETLSKQNRKTVALTFDDGYQDNLTVALPVLEMFRLPMTVFVVAGFVGTEGYLSKDELREIARHPLVTVGAHGLWHRHFDRLSPEEARQELCESRRYLEEIIRKKVDLMAWPFGDCTPELEALSAECGYRAAWSVWKGSGGSHSLWRVPLGRHDHFFRFVAKASGVYGVTEARLHRRHQKRAKDSFETSAKLDSKDARETRDLIKVA